MSSEFYKGPLGGSFNENSSIEQICLNGLLFNSFKKQLGGIFNKYINQTSTYQVQWVVLPKNSDRVVQISTATRSYDAFRWSIDNPSSTAWRLRISNAQVTDEGRYAPYTLLLFHQGLKLRDCVYTFVVS